MKSLSLQKLHAMAENPRYCARPFTPHAIDFSRPFIQEALSPLYYTSEYLELSTNERLRYNQLTGLKINEQFMVLESEVIERLFNRLADDPRILKVPRLSECLLQVHAEERRHLAMFRALNRLCLPEAYSESDYFLARPSLFERILTRLATSLPEYFSCLFWVLILIEEYTIGFSRQMMESDRTETLGPIEENFQSVHAEHIKDEYRHIQVDAYLLELFERTTPKWLRKLNNRLFKKIIKEVTNPTAAEAVIQRLALEMPELQPKKRRLINALRNLEHDERYKRSLFNPIYTPFTLELLESCEERRELRSALPDFGRNA